jgi:short subunit dehydrogenase-like uncharacterized protein
VRTAKVTQLIAMDSFAPHPRLAPLVPVLMLGVAPALHTPLRAVIDAAIDRLPEGPGEEIRRRAEFTVAVSAIGEAGATGHALVRGSDVYGVTAQCIAEGALRMASPSFAGAGALAPAQAFDPESFLATIPELTVS